MAAYIVRRRVGTEAVAHHEAGHAVADFRLGFRIRSVTIVSDGESAGVAYSALGFSLRTFSLTPAQIHRRHNKVITIMAGGVAQRKFDARSVRGHMLYPDLRAASEIMERLYGDDEERQAMYRVLEIRTKHLVNEAVNWRMIQDLSKVLLKKGTLAGPEVEAVFRSSWKRWTDEQVVQSSLRLYQPQTEVNLRAK